MLSSNSLRTLCSLRALGSPNWLLMNRKAGQTNVTFSVNTMNDVSYAMKDTWRNKTIHKSLEREKKTCFSTNAVFLRNYCTGQIKMNCWKCKQPLENDPAFFCLACKMVQPPEEGTSYFKIMDWWVPSVIFTPMNILPLNNIGSHNTFSFQWLYVRSGYT